MLVILPLVLTEILKPDPAVSTGSRTPLTGWPGKKSSKTKGRRPDRAPGNDRARSGYDVAVVPR